MATKKDHRLVVLVDGELKSFLQEQAIKVGESVGVIVRRYLELGDLPRSMALAGIATSSTISRCFSAPDIKYDSASAERLVQACYAARQEGRLLCV